MEQLNPDIIDAAQGLWGSVVTFFKLLWLPSRRNQLIAIAALIGLSWLVARLLMQLGVAPSRRWAVDLAAPALAGLGLFWMVSRVYG